MKRIKSNDFQNHTQIMNMLMLRTLILFFAHESFAEAEGSPLDLEKRRFLETPDADDSLFSFLKYKQRKSSNKKRESSFKLQLAS